MGAAEQAIGAERLEIALGDVFHARRVVLHEMVPGDIDGVVEHHGAVPGLACTERGEGGVVDGPALGDKACEQRGAFVRRAERLQIRRNGAEVGGRDE